MLPASKDHEALDLERVLSALGTALSQSLPERNLPAVLEQEVQQALSMRAVRLREIPSRYQVRLVTPTRTADAIVLDVPTGNPRTQAVLEAFCEPDRLLAESDVRALTSIAQLAGLVLEAARVRGGPATPLTDGAAPLIGSTPEMRGLRERIERVALTDFTVLIEGPTRR